MNHKPAIDWLFEDSFELSQSQTIALQEHLAECNSCQAVSESFRTLEVALHRTEKVEPDAGFSDRWQLRLLAHRQKIHRRQTITTLAFMLGGILALVVLLVLISLPWLRSPSLLVWIWIYQWIALLTYANSLREVLTPAILGIADLVPLLAWVFGFGIICELAVMWVVSFRLLTYPRRITK
jgi:hypothetical protein